MTTEKRRVEIVEKHLLAMMAELRKAGIDTVGIAGGIVLSEAADERNNCHVFHLVDTDVRPVGKEGISEAEFVEAFVVDVAGTMCRRADSGRPWDSVGTHLRPRRRR